MGYSVDKVNANTGVADTDSGSFLFDREGNRKYLTRLERNEFLSSSARMPPMMRTFCMTLAYTGARISEVLKLTPKRIDVESQIVVLESLKKRRRGMYRAVPVPQILLKELDQVHDIVEARKRLSANERIWTCCRTTAWAWVKDCMTEAGIVGAPASPKGLRHAFGVGTLQSGVPINLVKKWLGHSRLETTEIYADAVGDEERAIASRFWKTF